MLGPKKFRVQKILGPKKCEVKKKLSPKNVMPKKIESKKKIWPQKLLVKKKFEFKCRKNLETNVQRLLVILSTGHKVCQGCGKHLEKKIIIPDRSNQE